jgi:hypothetical protein
MDPSGLVQQRLIGYNLATDCNGQSWEVHIHGNDSCTGMVGTRWSTEINCFVPAPPVPAPVPSHVTDAGASAKPGPNVLLVAIGIMLLGVAATCVAVCVWRKRRVESEKQDHSADVDTPPYVAVTVN